MVESSAERREKRRPINLFFVRHGQTEDYVNPNASLTETGKQQVLEDFSRPLIQHLKNPLRPNFVKIISSDRIRTLQSAQVIHDHIRSEVANGSLNQTTLLSMKVDKRLSLTTPMSSLLKLGYPPEQVFSLWRQESEDYLRSLDIQTPAEIAQVVDRAIDNLEKLSSRNLNSPELNFVFVTHESVLGAIAIKYFPSNPSLAIGHAESIRVTLTQQGPIFNFGEKTATRNQ